MASGGDNYVPPSGGEVAPAGQDADGQKAMDDAELERVFKHFDSDGSGSIDVEELRSAMLALGIKVTMNSAKKILAVIDKDSNGTIEWDEFYEFFQKVKDPEEIRNMLSNANAKFLDYKMMVQQDPNFEKRFYVPSNEGPIKKFVGHEDNVEDALFVDPHSNNFITCSIDGTIKLWDVSTGKKQRDVVEDVPGGIYCLSVIRNGTKVFSGNGAKENNVMLFDLQTEDKAKVTEMTYTGHSAPIYSIGAEKCQNEKFFMTGAKNGKMIYYDSIKSEPLCVMEDFHEGVVYSVDFNEDGTTVITASSDGTCSVLDLRIPNKARKISYIDDAAASGVCFKALWRGEHEVLTCGDDYCVKKWDMRKLRDGPIENYLGHTSPVRTISLSPDGKHLVSGSNDGCIRLWVVDERTNIEIERNNVLANMETHEKKRAAFDAKIEDIENEEEIDEEVMRTTVTSIARAHRKWSHLQHCYDERDAMQCVQSRLGLDGHKLPVTTLAWRDNPGDKSKAQIISGSQDQTAMAFNVIKPKTNEFSKWAKDLSEFEK